MYMHVRHETSFPKLETMFRDLFGLKIDSSRVYRFKQMMASYYSETATGILRKLVCGSVIYADETEVKLKKTKGYVVVLSNTEEVLFLYRSSREVEFLSDLLYGFSGVLVTDFYPAVRFTPLPPTEMPCPSDERFERSPLGQSVRRRVQTSRFRVREAAQVDRH